jgi:uncharacterized protein
MKYRDKNEKIEIPEIPDSYILELDELLSYLKFKNERSALKLRKIYSYMDNFSQFVSNFAVCHKGCSYCCKIDIQLSRVEAELIKAETDKKYNEPIKISLNNTTTCPFLGNEGSCTIYDIRPFSCRVFFTLDHPKYCASDEPHYVYGSQNGVFTVNIFKELNDEILKLNNHSKMFDIRDYFKVN